MRVYVGQVVAVVGLVSGGVTRGFKLKRSDLSIPVVLLAQTTLTEQSTPYIIISRGTQV